MRSSPMIRFRTVGVLALASFVATIFAANWAVERYGVVPVGFGLEAPAAVFFVGAAFLFRDLAQRTIGRSPVVAAVVVGAALSYLVAPAFALASGIAFLASESLDFAAFTLLEKRLTIAVAVSNVVGALVDSYLFLTIAFGSLAFFSGQVVGKLWVTLVALPVVLASRWVVRPA